MHTTDQTNSPANGDTQKILFCNCSYSDVVGASTKREVLAALVNSGADFEAVPDLCGMAARRAPTLLRGWRQPNV
ncbi:MAG: hypothetical protein J7M19_05005 [Planctomycetes bacterium]|nr:hypothetical protein [Planctomycetota bacterium]